MGEVLWAVSFVENHIIIEKTFLVINDGTSAGLGSLIFLVMP